jgi:phospholipid transport system substrate-binding protein
MSKKSVTVKTFLLRGAAVITAAAFFGSLAAGHSAQALESSGASMARVQSPASLVLAVAASDQAETIAKGGGQTAGARSFVDAMAKKTVAFLADKALSEKQKKSQFRTLLFADFDMDTIGRFVLGTYWRTSTPAQRDEYLRLFREMIAAVWAERFESYEGQKFELRGARAAEDSAKDTIVSSVIIPQGNPDVRVEWRVRFKDGQYKIVDVVVEGVSLSVTQRSDFASVIQRGGGDVQVLLASLREQIK